MMDFRKIFAQFDLLRQCKKYKLPLWQCPQFLFLIMGMVIIVVVVTSYTLGARFIADPGLVVLIILSTTAVLLIIAYIITRSFERLAEASRLKSEFISVVSHQLRSPLSNLSWAIELLMSGKLGRVEEKQVDYFQILKKNSTRMNELVSDLLTVSRIETATLPLEEKEIFAEELVKKVIDRVDPFAKASNIKIEFKFQKDLPKIFVDPSKIEKVLENLIDNAIRYIKDSGRVEIKLEKRRKWLYFEIKDSGVGIPKEDQKYIFKRFFRARNVLRYQTEGSGLGLYIAKSIIKRSKGNIDFKSNEGQGTTFWFTLPIKQ